jgi:hypothetical protein
LQSVLAVGLNQESAFVADAPEVKQQQVRDIEPGDIHLLIVSPPAAATMESGRSAPRHGLYPAQRVGPDCRAAD